MSIETLIREAPVVDGAFFVGIGQRYLSIITMDEDDGFCCRLCDKAGADPLSTGTGRTCEEAFRNAWDAYFDARASGE